MRVFDKNSNWWEKFAKKFFLIHYQLPDPLCGYVLQNSF